MTESFKQSHPQMQCLFFCIPFAVLLFWPIYSKAAWCIKATWVSCASFTATPMAMQLTFYLQNFVNVTWTLQGVHNVNRKFTVLFTLYIDYNGKVCKNSQLDGFSELRFVFHTTKRASERSSWLLKYTVNSNKVIQRDTDLCLLWHLVSGYKISAL